MDADLANYRALLVDTLRALNEAYDKILVTLSGGALGLSIVFLKDVIGDDMIASSQFLVGAWFGFILSLGAVLSRILFGIEAYRCAIRQVDDGTIRDGRVGGVPSKISRGCHIASAVFLLLGLSSIAIFSYMNVGVVDVR